MSNGNGNGNNNNVMAGWPIWAKLIAVLGFPIVLNLLLLWFGWRTLNYIIDTEIVRYVADNNAILKKHVNDLENVNVDLTEMKQIMWAICVNTADIQENKTRCWTTVYPRGAQR